MKRLLFVLFLLCSSSFIFSQTTSSHSSSTNKVSITCAGKNKKGDDCGMIVKKKGDFCRYHSPNKIVCGSNTKANKPCQMVVNKAGEKCWRHKS